MVPASLWLTEIFEQCDAEDENADNGISETPSPPPSEQERTRGGAVFKILDGNTHQEGRSERGLPGWSGLVVPGEIFGQCDAEDRDGGPQHW